MPMFCYPQFRRAAVVLRVGDIYDTIHQYHLTANRVAFLHKYRKTDVHPFRKQIFGSFWRKCWLIGIIYTWLGWRVLLIIVLASSQSYHHHRPRRYLVSGRYLLNVRLHATITNHPKKSNLSQQFCNCRFCVFGGMPCKVNLHCWFRLWYCDFWNNIFSMKYYGRAFLSRLVEY